MTSKKAVRGDIITPIKSVPGIIKGNRYYVHRIQHSEVNDSNYQVIFFDNMSDERAFYYEGDYEIVGNINTATILPPAHVTDIHAQDVVVGDYVAYAWNTGRTHGQGVWQITRFDSSNIAIGKAVPSGTERDLPLMAERGLLLKNYNK